jgi:mRNA interferase RelE/StbE
MKPRAAKDLDQLQGETWQRVRDALMALRDDPRPHGYTRLRGEVGYRIRIGDWRATYDIDDQNRVVTILRVRHRRDIYRKL